MPDIPFRVAFLRKSHLFHGLSDQELVSVAETMQENSYQANELVFTEGAAADAFYMVYKGRVQLSRQNREQGRRLATLFEGDYFGERGLIKGAFRNATVKAAEATTLLILYRDDFKKLLKKAPHLWENFDLMMDSRQLATQLKFGWLKENEVIYFLARKHVFLLVRALVLPVLGLSGILGLLMLAYLFQWLWLGAAGGFFLVIDLAWGLWRYVDWGNDFYIVTNQRVVWLEKVIGLYDSRQEAPMSTILSVNTESDFWGRYLDYGTVIVRIFTGQIRMTYVRHPKQAAGMIEEYWNRAKSATRQMDEESIKNAIRTKLGVARPAQPPALSTATSGPATRESKLAKSWRELFTLRSETGDLVTYRKHWVVLLRDTFLQIISLLGLLVASFASPFVIGTPPLWLVLIELAILLGIIGWWIYGFEDWRNDQYQVTPDQIIDVYKRPFGVEDRKAAPLEGILSTEYKRSGLFQYLFNYGTVFINVGGAKFDFEDVADPPTVLQDILRRQEIKLIRKKEAETAVERDRMASWLAYYHKTMQEIEAEKKQSHPGNPG
jgi:hypothetical protein